MTSLILSRWRIERFSNLWSIVLMHNSIMKTGDLQQPVLNLSNDASTNELPTYDQETGSNATDSIETTRKPLHFIFRRNLITRVMAEAVGSFILVFCINGITGLMEVTKGGLGLLEFAVTAALTVIVVAYSVGPISGGHVNPAITLAFAIVGPFPWLEVPFYISAQVGGSVLATYAAKFVYGVNAKLFTTIPLHGHGEAFWVELIATFIILFVIAALINEHNVVGNLSGFVIGVVIGLGVLITGPVSGGSMNPARSLGPALVTWKLEYMWIYIIAPIVGAVAGAMSFRALSNQLNPFPILPSAV